MAGKSILTEESLVTFSILSEGKEIPNTYGVISIKVLKEVNKITHAKIIIADGGTAEKDKFVAGESDNFVPGKKITIKAGYESKEEPIFEGIVIKHGLQILPGRGARLVIECKHEASKLTIGRKNNIFLDKKDSDIIGSILSDAGIGKSVKATKNKHLEVVQHYATDWDFILMRADINGMIVIPDGKKLKIEPPNFSESPKYNLTFGKGVISFNAEIDARTQLSAVTGYSWDTSNQKLLEAKADPTKITPPGNFKQSDLAKVTAPKDYVLQSAATLENPVLDDWATAKLAKSNLAFLKGSISFRGVADIEPGSMLNLEGFGKRFDGDVFVGGVEHKIESGNWITEAKLGMSNDWYFEMVENVDVPLASGMLPGFQGLSIGVVKKIHEDKSGNFKIQVTIPTLQKDNMGLWARLSSFYATKEAGAFFVPEVKDEVIVGFLNGDPQHPVVLGVLYNKKNKSPNTVDEKNEIKSFTTKTDLKLEFDEKDNKITIITKSKNQLVLDDNKKKITIKDQHNNLIEFSSKGIMLKSPKDVIIDAKNLKVKTKSNTEVKATADVKVEGVNVKLKGSATFAAEGGTAEVKGSGTTTIKGGIVQIN